MGKKHFVVLLAAALWLHAGAPVANSVEAGGIPNATEFPGDLVRLAMGALEARASKEDAETGEARCRRALELAAADSVDAAAAHNVLGAILETQGRLVEARQELEIALAARERLFGSGDLLLADTLDKLGLVYRQQGHLEQAETLYRKAIEILRQKPTVELGAAFHNLGNDLAAQGRLDEAESALRRAIDVWEKLLGSEHPNLAAALSNLSSLERARHHYPQAERLLQRALEMDRKLLPAGSVRIGLDLNNAGTLFAARKHYGDAEGALRDSLSILRSSLPANHPEIGRVSVNLGTVLRLEHKTVEGDERYWEGIQILVQAWGPQDPRLLSLLRPSEEHRSEPVAEPTGMTMGIATSNRMPVRF
jgi:tetratricopeptide (TPR) repeat protein